MVYRLEWKEITMCIGHVKDTVSFVTLTCAGRTVVPVVRAVPVAIQMGSAQQAVQQLSVMQLTMMNLRRIHRTQETGDRRGSR